MPFKNQEFKQQLDRSFRNFRIAWWTSVVLYLILLGGLAFVAVHFLAKVW